VTFGALFLLVRLGLVRDLERELVYPDTPLSGDSSRVLFCSNNVKDKTILLPVVLYGFETLSQRLREEHRLRVFENRVPRRIFGPKSN
jgi:hypothetical protein